MEPTPYGREEGRAVADALALVRGIMRGAGITHKELARRTGKMPSNVSHMLQPGYNMTVRTLAALLAACGKSLRFVAVDAADEDS